MTSLAVALQHVERFDVTGAVIVQGASGATDANTSGGNDVDVSGRLVASATGYTYTNPSSGTAINSNKNVDVSGIQIPQGTLALVDFAQVRGGSELSNQMLVFSLAIGDNANRAGSLVSQALQGLGRPFDRDGKIAISRWVKGDCYLRIQVTNNDSEAPHIAEARLTGWLIRNGQMTQADLDEVARVLLSGGAS